jgi:hypothetical protein
MMKKTGMALPTENVLWIAVSLIIAFGLIACNHSASSSSSASDTDLTPQDAEARKALLAEIQKHWQHGADGWTASAPTAAIASSGNIATSQSTVSTLAT